MRFDNRWNFRTLEEDIAEAFRKHGSTVTKEEFQEDTWIITAIRQVKE